MSKSTSSVQQVSNHVEEVFICSEDVQCSIVLALVNLLGWEEPVDTTLPNIIIQY